MSKETQLFVNTLRKKGITLGLAESVTCGLAAHNLSAVKGTSDVLKGAVVCYSPEVKTSLLKIPKKLIRKHTCESKQVTQRLARNLPQLIKADIYAAITGLATEGGSENKHKPVGTMFFSVRYKGKSYNQRKVFKGTPLQMKEKACLSLYKLIVSII